MPANIIDITNVVELTNTIYFTNEIIYNVTNTLNKIDIMNIPTANWDIANIIISVIVAGIMFYTVRKMAEQNKLSAESIQEMKNNSEHNEKKEHLRLLYIFIREDVYPILEKVHQLTVDDYISILGKYSIIFNNFRFYQGGYYKREKGFYVHSTPRPFSDFIGGVEYFCNTIARTHESL